MSQQVSPPSSVAPDPFSETSSDSAFNGSEAGVELEEGICSCGIENTGRSQGPHRKRSVLIDRQKDVILRKLHQKITEQDIHKISGLFGSEWMSLGRQLGFKDFKIKSFAEYENYREKAHAMLIAFIQGEGNQATRARLIEALEHENVGRRDIAEKLQEGEELEVKYQRPLVLYPKSNFIDNNNAGKFSLCTDEDGQEFLVCPVDGSEFKQACKNLLTSYNEAKKVIDAHSPVAREKETQSGQQEQSLEKQKLQKLKEDLDRIITFQRSQEQHEDRVIVTDDAKECANLVDNLQNNCTQLLRLTSAACRLTEPLNMKTEICEHSTKLSYSHGDLEERIIWLKDKASRNPELVHESKKLEKILKQCQSLGKEIKMRERFCHKLLQNEYNSDQERTQSAPERRRPPSTEKTWRPNSSFEPTSSPTDQIDFKSTSSPTDQADLLRVVTVAPTTQTWPEENESEA